MEIIPFLDFILSIMVCTSYYFHKIHNWVVTKRVVVVNVISIYNVKSNLPYVSEWSTINSWAVRRKRIMSIVIKI